MEPWLVLRVVIGSWSKQGGLEEGKIKKRLSKVEVERRHVTDTHVTEADYVTTVKISRPGSNRNKSRVVLLVFAWREVDV